MFNYVIALLNKLCKSNYMNNDFILSKSSAGRDRDV